MARAGLIVTLLGALVPAAAVAQAPAGTLQQAAIPGELSASIKAELGDTSVKATIDSTTLEFWWVKSLAGTAEGPGWGDVENGTLVGALRVSGAFKDVRGKTVKPGVYTLRFGLQPQNGDHLGVSPFREFLLISPVAVDTDLDVAGLDGVVALAKLTIGTSHPASLSIDPPEADAAVLSPHTSEMGHKGLIFEVPRRVQGKPAGTLKFGLILVGTIVH